MAWYSPFFTAKACVILLLSALARIHEMSKYISFACWLVWMEALFQKVILSAKRYEITFVKAEGFWWRAREAEERSKDLSSR